MNRIAVFFCISMLFTTCLAEETQLNTEPTLGALRRKATAAINSSTAEFTRIISVCNDSGVKLSQSLKQHTQSFTRLASSKATSFSEACRAALGFTKTPDLCEQYMSCESETVCKPGNIVLCAH